MKIAIPLKMNKKESAIAPLFGKAKWFAIIENGQIEIKENNCSGGQAVIEWLEEMKVDTIILQEMGRTPYNKIKAYGTIKVYHSGYERVLLLDTIEKFNKNELEELNDVTIEAVIAHHEKRHPAHNHH